LVNTPGVSLLLGLHGQAPVVSCAAALQKAIEETKSYPGITGAITFAAYSHVPQKGVTIIAVKGGKFTLGAEVVPEKVPAP